MSRYIGLFLILVSSSGALGHKCVAYNFENDFDYLISSNSSICQGMAAWELGSYSAIGIDSPNAGSTKFAFPSAYLSCASSFAFPMEGRGTVEILAYIKSKSNVDQLTAVVSQIVTDGNDPTVGVVFLGNSSPTFEDGWHTLSVELVNVGPFDGYITFLGMQSEDSIVLIDSFRYIPPSEDANNCAVYEGDTPTTTESVTPQPITTTRPVESEQCFTLEFGSDFDNLFTNDRNLCQGFASWSFGNYSDIEIDSVNNYETYLSPKEYSSCISSFAFPMSPEGIVEVKVYMDPKSSLDHIIVLAKKSVNIGRDTVAGLVIYEPSRTSFARGWSTIRISLVDLSTFDGYLIFLGQAAEGSTVLIHSFRYIPPWVKDQDVSCTVLKQSGY